MNAIICSCMAGYLNTVISGTCRATVSDSRQRNTWEDLRSITTLHISRLKQQNLMNLTLSFFQQHAQNPRYVRASLFTILFLIYPSQQGQGSLCYCSRRRRNPRCDRLNLACKRHVNSISFQGLSVSEIWLPMGVKVTFRQLILAEKHIDMIDMLRRGCMWETKCPSERLQTFSRYSPASPLVKALDNELMRTQQGIFHRTHSKPVDDFFLNQTGANEIICKSTCKRHRRRCHMMIRADDEL